MKLSFLCFCLVLMVGASAASGAGSEFVISISTVSNTAPTGAHVPAATPQRSLKMNLESSVKPLPDAMAEVVLPPGLEMGQKVNLKVEGDDMTAPQTDIPVEALKMTLFWSSGKNVQSGQPKLISWKDMPDAVKNALKPGAGSPERSTATWQALPKDIKTDAQIVGSYSLMSYAGSAAITLDAPQAFLPPLEVATSADGKGEGPIEISWKSVPGVQAFFVTAHGMKSDGTIIGWTSGNSPDAAISAHIDSFMDEKEMARLIEKGILLSPQTTNCTIPTGVFQGSEGALIAVTAYGRDKQVRGKGVVASVVVRSEATVAREFPKDLSGFKDTPGVPFPQDVK